MIVDLFFTWTFITYFGDLLRPQLQPTKHQKGIKLSFLSLKMKVKSGLEFILKFTEPL